MQKQYRRNTELRRLLRKIENEWLTAGGKILIKRRELLLIKRSIEKTLPKLVHEHTIDWDWCYCPNCYAILDREYMQYCDFCGQALSWHGTLKHAVRISYAEAGRRSKANR